MVKLTEERLKDIKNAAASLLTDNEIQTSLRLTDEEFESNYDLIEQTRINVKQSLNAKKIISAGNSGDVNSVIIPRSRKRNGGARRGAGRPKGASSKITATKLQEAIRKHTGEDFEELLAEGYNESIENNDIQTRLVYERLFLSKLMTDVVAENEITTPSGLRFRIIQDTDVQSRKDEPTDE